MVCDVLRHKLFLHHPVDKAQLFRSSAYQKAQLTFGDIQQLAGGIDSIFPTHGEMFGIL